MNFIIARIYQGKRYTTVLTEREISLVSSIDFDEQCRRDAIRKLDDFESARFRIIRQTPLLLESFIDEYMADELEFDLYIQDIVDLSVCCERCERQILDHMINGQELEQGISCCDNVYQLTYLIERIINQRDYYQYKGAKTIFVEKGQEDWTLLFEDYYPIYQKQDYFLVHIADVPTPQGYVLYKCIRCSSLAEAKIEVMVQRHRYNKKWLPQKLNYNDMETFLRKLRRSFSDINSTSQINKVDIYLLAEQKGYTVYYDQGQQTLQFCMRTEEETVVESENLFGKHLWVQNGLQEKCFFCDKSRADIESENMEDNIFTFLRLECAAFPNDFVFEL